MNVKHLVILDTILNPQIMISNLRWAYSIAINPLMLNALH